MTEKPLSLRERNRIRTRDEILLAMSRLLGERPFDAITVDDVAAQAGVSRGTIYTYFADGRDQLVRDAYLRMADIVIAAGATARAKHDSFTDRVVALAESFATAAATAEGRFYGVSGPGVTGPLSSVTGTASGRYLTMLTEDLASLEAAGHLRDGATPADLAHLLGGAVREIGAVAAREPHRVPDLLAALRVLCDSVQR